MLDRESCLRGRGARIKRTHTKLERVCSRNQDVDNKKPFVARLPESAGQRQGFQGQRRMPSRERLPVYRRTESLGGEGGGKGEEPN